MTPETLQALQTLRDNGVSLADIAACYGTDREGEARAVPPPSVPEADKVYTLPSVPPETATHFANGQPQALSVGVLWAGFSYTLTAGQRAVLREAYGLTPSATVTVTAVEPWSGTRHPHTLALRSDIHIDPRARKHVLTSVRLTRVGEFFTQANELDEAKRREKVFGLTPSTLTLGRVFDLEAVERWAVEDITGVKLHKRVEITSVASDGSAFTLSCAKTGNTTRIDAGKFFATVAEYIPLHETRRPTSTQRDATTLMDMIRSLEGAA